jgi:phosphatidylglycerol---prolipoprotein diacylglyceryl transferase
MLPTFQLFGRTIAMYGSMIAVGLLVGITIALLRSKKYNFLTEDVLFASLFGGIGLFVGAKLLFIITVIPKLITHRKILFAHPNVLLAILSGGFVFYGGLIGAILGFYIYCRKFRLDFIRILDLIAPSIPIIHGFGRIGCYFAGCCYGIHYTGPGHVIFHLSNYAPDHIPLFPTQTLESILNFLFGIALLFYAKRHRKPGTVLGVYFIYYAVMRFTLEFFRGDIARGFFLGLSTSQWISLLFLPIGVWLVTGLKPFRFSRKG